MPAPLRAGIDIGFAVIIGFLVFFCTNTANDKKRALYEQKINKLNSMLDEQHKSVLEQGTLQLKHRKTMKNLVDENDDLHLH